MDLDVLSPLAFVAVGALSLFVRATLRGWQSVRASRGPAEERLVARFESRGRVSWVLIVVGALWLAQVVVERKLGLTASNRLPASEEISYTR